MAGVEKLIEKMMCQHNNIKFSETEKPLKPYLIRELLKRRGVESLFGQSIHFTAMELYECSREEKLK